MRLLQLIRGLESALEEHGNIDICHIDLRTGEMTLAVDVEREQMLARLRRASRKLDKFIARMEARR